MEPTHPVDGCVRSDLVAGDSKAIFEIVEVLDDVTRMCLAGRSERFLDPEVSSASPCRIHSPPREAIGSGFGTSVNPTRSIQNARASSSPSGGMATWAW
jgi:hypothetical protein